MGGAGWEDCLFVGCDIIAPMGFRSQHLGVRRLAVTLATASFVVITAFWSTRAFGIVQRHNWRNEYFRSEVEKHPQLKIVKDGRGIYLVDTSPKPQWDWYKTNNTYDWRWAAVEDFSSDADSPPSGFDYLWIIAPSLCGAILVWFLIHATAWVISGFTPRTRV